MSDLHIEIQELYQRGLSENTIALSLDIPTNWVAEALDQARKFAAYLRDNDFVDDFDLC